jgi:subtilase family serine protease
MTTEGFRHTAHKAMLLLSTLIFCQPLWAQHIFVNLPQLQSGENPISFMGPHYAIHVAAGSSPAAPPSSALTPAQTRHAYGFDLIANQGAGQTIGIVDAYDDPNAEADLGTFDTQFKLAACTTSNSCFRKIYSRGTKPATNANWAVEIALDVEWAHAIAPQARVILVEAPSNSLSDLLYAVDVAVQNGASAVSMSWTAGEFYGENSQDVHFARNGVTFLAASGDSGTGVAYPAASPDVIGVGGTTLTLANGNYHSETAWSGSGGGISAIEREPAFQSQFGIPDDPRGYRGVPDVSYNANPATGYAIYDSIGINGYGGWFQVGGTSAGTPQWAALVAIANSTRIAARKTYLTSTDTPVYSIAKSGATTNFHAVTQGTNGTCGTICTALPGYDYVTGLGTPQSSALVASLAAQR